MLTQVPDKILQKRNALILKSAVKSQEIIPQEIQGSAFIDARKSWKLHALVQIFLGIPKI